MYGVRSSLRENKDLQQGSQDMTARAGAALRALLRHQGTLPHHVKLSKHFYRQRLGNEDSLHPIRNEVERYLVFSIFNNITCPMVWSSLVVKKGGLNVIRGPLHGSRESTLSL